MTNSQFETPSPNHPPDYPTKLRLAAQNALALHHLEDVLCAFRENDIPAIVLKGAVLLPIVYSDLSQRAMGDVDLWVRPPDRERARKTLLALGYLQVHWEAHVWRAFDAVGEWGFRHPDGTLVELHWHLTPVEWFRRMADLDEDALWRAAESFSLGRAQALRLSDADMALHLALHVAMHNFAHPTGFRDLHLWLTRSTVFPWADLVERAQRLRLSTATGFALTTVQAVYDTPAPPWVLKTLRPSPCRRWLLARVADPVQGARGHLGYSRVRHLVHFLVADRVRDMVRAAIWLLFPGPRWLARRYGLSNPVGVVFFALAHPGFILIRAIQSMVSVWAPLPTRTLGD